jgi:hypothetical protein
MNLQADEKGVGIHMHVAEIEEEVKFCKEKHGMTTVSHLNKVGLLGNNLLAVHSVWLSDEEVTLYKDRKVNVSHCPAAAMRYNCVKTVVDIVAILGLQEFLKCWKKELMSLLEQTGMIFFWGILM